VIRVGKVMKYHILPEISKSEEETKRIKSSIEAFVVGLVDNDEI
jgi:hypothetical protein